MSDGGLVLREVAIKDFRGLVGERTFKIGNVTLLLGPNGLGKTTVFDAIDWALFGNSWRLGEEDAKVLRNLWAPRPPSVSLRFDGDTLVRTEAEAHWEKAGAYEPTRDLSRDPTVFANRERVAEVVRALTYLSQEQMRSLVNAENSGQRAAALAVLAGIPGADVLRRNVELTLKNARERLAERQLEVDQLSTRAGELSDAARAAFSQMPVHEMDVRRDAAGFLGVDASIPIVDLFERSKQRLNRSRLLWADSDRRREACSSLLARFEQLRPRVDQIDGTLTQAVNDHRNAQDAYTAATAHHQVAARAHDAARQLLATAQDDAGMKRKRREALEQRVKVAENLRALEAERVTARQATSSAAEQTSIAAQALTAATEKLAAAGSARQAADLGVRNGRLHVARQRELERARGALVRASTELARVRESSASDSGSLRRATERETQLSEQLRQERERGQQLGSAAAHIAALVDQLGEIDGIDERSCPVCGHSHTSAAELREAAASALSRVGGLAGDRRRLAAIEGELREVAVELVTARKASTQSAAELASLQVALRNAEAEVRSLESSSVGASAPVDDLALLEERLRLSEEKLAEAAAAERRLRERWTVAATVDAQQNRLLLEVERRLAAASSGPPGHAPTPEEIAVAELDAVAAEAAVPALLASATECATALTRAQEAVTAANGHLTLRGTQLRSAEEAARHLREDISAIRGSLAALVSDATSQDLLGSLSAARDELTLRTETASAAVKQAEAVVAAMNALVENSQARRLEEEKASVDEGLTQARMRVAGANVALAALQVLEEQVQSASARAAEGAVERGTRAVQEVFRAVNPHGHLNLVQLFRDGTVRIKDSETGQLDVSAEPYSSTGQLNSLALSLFLGMGISQKWSRLRLLMLDEPVQNLDDVRFLNVIDLVRRIALRHQVILSTADANVGELLLRKLRLWAQATNNQLEIHSFVEFDREHGPKLVQADPSIARRG